MQTPFKNNTSIEIMLSTGSKPSIQNIFSPYAIDGQEIVATFTPASA